MSSMPSATMKPRRVARFMGALFGIVAGLFYIIFPPEMITDYLGSTWPVAAWGAFFLAGGIVSSAAWWSRILVMDRLGLSFLITGTLGLLFAQTGLMLVQPITYARGGGTVVLAILAAYLIARWQDVRHDEQEAEWAIRVTDEAPDVSIGGEADGVRH